MRKISYQIIAMNKDIFNELKKRISGEINTDLSHRIAYSTDASIYKESPIAVIYPKSKADLIEIVSFSKNNKIPVISRTAGTSIAGQVVGSGIIVDFSKHFNKIIEINSDEKWAIVEPGVVLDELNKELEKYNLFFGPETSTSNRCMIGGMVANNSCGSRSLIYGSTRDHTIEIEAILSDGSEVVFNDLSVNEFNEKLKSENLEGEIYRNINSILSNNENIENIANEYPDKDLKRRNTGYAIDLLAESELFSNSKYKFNFCKLLSGSEGTLAFFTSIKLNLVELPAKNKAVMCVHMSSLSDAFDGNLIALKHYPTSVELLDKKILDLTKNNIEQSRNRFFIKGEPDALLIIEFVEKSEELILEKCKNIENDLKASNIGYHFPIIKGKDISKVWNLRKAGLGVLSNMPGDRKPIAIIEDTAVNPKYLSEYISEINNLLKKYNLECVYFAHIGTGELHLRPILNIKDENDKTIIEQLTRDVALLVKKYKGSLSGEHGDGRLRSQYIELMIGEKNYQLLKEIKNTWDSENIFNPGKILNSPKINSNLRFDYKLNNNIKTFLNFSNDKGFLRALEKCNGSADCRKSSLIGGTMCPSFMATKNEINTTRARANILREFIANSNKENPFNYKELYDILDLCISCKGCKSECPSNIDMAKLKAEFLFNWYKSNPVSFRTLMFAHLPPINKFAFNFRKINNFFLADSFFSEQIKRFLKVSKNRTLPLLSKKTLFHYLQNHKFNSSYKKEVYLFVDEFTNYNESELGIKAILLLNKLGYKVNFINNSYSGRTYISKGFLIQAKMHANKNVKFFSEIISEEKPLIGIEPSAILSFRDEYPDLVDEDLIEKSKNLAKNCLLIDEFIANEFEKGNISKVLFISDKKEILLHAHCQQKAIVSSAPSMKILQIPENFSVKEIPSGCCGMAGSFGYEKEHYELSMNIGNLVLFPEIKNSSSDTIISAPGTSCRHHIKDGTKRNAFHPIEILFDSLK